MKTSELISQLALQNSPTRILYPPSIRLILWLFCSFVWMGGLIFYFGLSPDVSKKIIEISFWLESFPLLLMAVLAGYVCLSLGVPGSAKSSHLKKLAVVFLIGWLFAFIAGIPSRSSHVEPVWGAGPGRLCVESILELSAVPAIFLFWMIKRAAPTFPGWNGAMALFATASLAALGTQWICPYEFPLHFLVWHLIPAWLIALAGFFLGTKIFRWIPKLRT